MRKLIGILCIAFFAFESSLHAAVGVGGTGASFLKTSTNARATSLADAVGAVPGDSMAMEYNPAALCGLYRFDFSATYVPYLEDTKFQSVSFAYPWYVKSKSTPDPYEIFQFNQNKLIVGAQYKAFRAEDTARNASGVELGDFDLRDQMIGVSAAYPLLPKLGVGITGKQISQKIDKKSASTFAFDGGLLYKVSDLITAGAAFQNFGGDIGFVDKKDPLPRLIRLSVSGKWSQFLLMADVSSGEDGVLKKAGGAEWTINRYLQFRAGTFHDTALQFTGGLGLRLSGPEKADVSVPQKAAKKNSLGSLGSGNTENSDRISTNTLDFGLDYGLSTHGDLGITHTVSLRIFY